MRVDLKKEEMDKKEKEHLTVKEKGCLVCSRIDLLMLKEVMVLL